MVIRAHDHVEVLRRGYATIVCRLFSIRRLLQIKKHALPKDLEALVLAKIVVSFAICLE